MSDILSAEQVKERRAWINSLAQHPVASSWLKVIERSHEALRAERDAAIQRAESAEEIVQTIDEVLVVNWVGPRVDGDYRRALGELVANAATKHDDPSLDEAAALHQSTIAAQTEEIRVLRDALEHTKGFLKHREDSQEVCYDWCPLCRVESALAATPQPASATVAENTPVQPAGPCSAEKVLGWLGADGYINKEWRARAEAEKPQPAPATAPAEVDRG